MSEDRKTQLATNVVFGLPGAAEHMTLDMVRTHLSEYDRISPEALRQHLIDFLSEVVPTAESLGLRMCCHPDDPPFGCSAFRASCRRKPTTDMFSTRCRVRPMA
jgi:mannonate dehydratase